MEIPKHAVNVLILFASTLILTMRGITYEKNAKIIRDIAIHNFDNKLNFESGRRRFFL